MRLCDACSGLPDWGSPSVGSPGFSPGMDDEAVARQLQRQYDWEVQGPAGTNSLDNDSFAVARQLQVNHSPATAISVQFSLIDKHWSNRYLQFWSCIVAAVHVPKVPDLHQMGSSGALGITVLNSHANNISTAS